VPDKRPEIGVGESESQVPSANNVRICTLRRTIFVMTQEVVKLRFSNGIAGEV